MISYELGYFALNAYCFGEQVQKKTGYGLDTINTETQQEFLESTHYDVTKNILGLITAYGFDNISNKRFKDGFAAAYEEKCQSPEFGDIEDLDVCLDMASQNISDVGEQASPNKARLAEEIGYLTAHSINLSERESSNAGLQTINHFYDWSSFDIVKYTIRILKKLSKQDLMIEKVQDEFFQHIDREKGRPNELWQQLLDEIK